MSRKGKYFLCALLVVLFFSLGYLAYSHNQQQEKSRSLQVNHQQTEWKRIKVGELSFEYPKDWEEKTFPQNMTTETSLTDSNAQINIISGNHYYQEKNRVFNFDEWKETYVGKSPKKIMIGKTEAFVLDSRGSKTIVFDSPDSVGHYAITIWVPKNMEGKYKLITDHIFSSLKHV